MTLPFAYQDDDIQNGKVWSCDFRLYHNTSHWVNILEAACITGAKEERRGVPTRIGQTNLTMLNGWITMKESRPIHCKNRLI